MKRGLAVRLADTVMRRYPDADSYPYRSWSYPQGYLLTGMIKLWEATGEPRYRDYICKYAESHVTPDGQVRGFTGCSMDDMMAGAVLVWMYEQTKEPRYAAACHGIARTFSDYPRTREGGFLHNRTEYPGEMWVDGVFMGQMFYSRYGRAFDVPECFDETGRQLQLISDYCHTHDGLLAHAYSEDDLASWAGAGGRSSCVWSEGLGWYALILSEALDIVPKHHPAWETARRQLRMLLDGLCGLQDVKSGLWYQVVDQPDRPGNWCDVSGSAMFTYAFCHALDYKLVEGERYRNAAARGYDGISGRIRPDREGLLDVHGACEGLCVQEDYEAYIRYPQKVNGQEAVCGCLWAAIAAEYGMW